MNKVQVGTEFRSTYADGNPLWRVTKAAGRAVWEAKVIPEPDGLPSDWVGTVKAFRTVEIVGSLGMQAFWEKLGQDHNAFYTSLQPGQIVHYSNGFDEFVRCRAIKKGKEMVLLPIALVGAWRGHDLPQRNRDGSIHNGYHVDRILKQETMTPNASNIYENMSDRSRYRDPRAMEPVSLTVPEMTPEFAARAALWRKVAAVRKATELQAEDPQTVLEAIATAMDLAA